MFPALTAGPAASWRARGAVARALSWLAGGICAALAVALILTQWNATLTPCANPACSWPRLDASGVAALESMGLGLSGYAAAVSVAAAAWCAVPLGLGLLIVRSAPPRLAATMPYAWFILALVAVSPAAGTGLPADVMRILGLGCWFFIFATFPTGSFSPRWTLASVVAAVAWTGVLTFVPTVRDALFSGDVLWWTFQSVGYLALVVVVFVGQLVRYLRGSPDVRRQLRLLLVALVPLIALGVGASFLGADQDTFGFGKLGGAILFQLSSLATTLLLACVGLAVIRHGAYGARLVFNRVLLGAVATITAAAVYAATVLLVSSLVSGWLPQAVAAVSTALTLALLFGRLARWIDRLVYGDAADPAALVRALGLLLPEARSPHELLVDIAETIALRLRLPALELVFADPAVPIITVGAASPGQGRESLRLTLGETPVATASVALRPGQRRLTALDRKALAAAAGSIAAGATAYRMNVELQDSRLTLVTAREEERRALRSRLHDELGPTLASITHRVAAAARDLRHAPDQAEEHLRSAEGSLLDASAHVRAVSRSLRPPALDELGLVRAIELFADGLGLPTTVTASIPGDLPPVVEVAVYRIVVEALVNASRHARASRVTVDLRSQERTLTVDVSDDGVGFAARTEPGVGLASIRERTNELGGTLSLGVGPEGGAQVLCELPVTSWRRA